MDEKLRVIQPCGILSSGLEVYFLIRPEPVPGDSWEGDNCYRFVAVPMIEIAIEQKGNETYKVYDYARHVVTNAFSIEYKSDMEYIYVRPSDKIVQIKQETIEEDKNGKETDDFPF